MVTNSQNLWWSRAGTLAVWALASASVAWWGLRLAGGLPSATTAPLSVNGAAEPVVDERAVARILGATPLLAAAPSASVVSRFVLLGVVASRSRQGAALIAVDGKPGRPYRVGSKIDEGVFLQSVEPRRARLAPAAGAEPTLTIELPPLKK